MTYAETGPSNDEFAVNLKRVVHTYMKARDLKTTDMWRLLHMPKTTWYTRMADGDWTARQMAHLAAVLDVEIQDLYLTPDELFRSRCFTPLSLLSGEGDGTDDTPHPRRQLRSVK